MLRAVRSIAIAIAVAVPVQASAVLIGVDLISAGDELGTLDTDTGLTWLDLTETLGVQGDPAAIVASLNPALGTDWRFASGSELCTLYENAGIVSCAGFVPGALFGVTNTNAAAGQALIDLIGETSAGGPFSDSSSIGHFLFDPGQPHQYSQSNVTLHGIGSVSVVIEARDTVADPNEGSFLVLPEASSAVLVALGIGSMLAWIRRS